MIAEIARWIVIAFGLWIAAVGVLMALAPQAALSGLARMGSTPIINVTELGLRLAAGLAIWLAADLSRWPDGFRVAGGFVVITSVLLLAIPRRWHHGYAVWWANRLKPLWVRLLAPAALIAGAVVVWSVA